MISSVGFTRLWKGLSNYCFVPGFRACSFGYMGLGDMARNVHVEA